MTTQLSDPVTDEAIAESVGDAALATDEMTEDTQ